MKNQKPHFDYSRYGCCKQVVLPLDIETIIPEDDSVRLLSLILEELNYSKLYEAYSPKGRNPVVDPKILFKILVYSYTQCIYSSRKIEKACRRDINFKFLLDGEKVPDHNTISRFRSERLALVIEHLFTQLVEILISYDEIPFKNVFIDGTKIEANANKYTFVWKKSTYKNELNLQTKIKEFISNTLGYRLTQDFISVNIMQEMIDLLLEKSKKMKVEFVYGKGKRKTVLQKNIETLKDFVEKQEKYDYYNSVFNGRNSFSKTDIDATFMHLKEDHMKNGQLKPAYNVQLAVESEYIIALDISSERADAQRLIPILKNIENNYEKQFKNIVCDAGYESEENYKYLEDHDLNSYIKPINYKQIKKRSFKSYIGRKENMKYDSELDIYTCANNRLLKPIYLKNRTNKSGYISEVQVYECESCNDCFLRSKCFKGKNNKRIECSKVFTKLRERSQDNIKNELGILLRINRSIQVEGAFGVTKQDYKFKRFLMRGHKNVRTEYYLLALAFNIDKLHNRI
ncbi:IS1182 family transposase, partial [Clostridioides difficile]|nr:IS1182 family transposase [Clostridioides difficile]